VPVPGSTTRDRHRPRTITLSSLHCCSRHSGPGRRRLCLRRQAPAPPSVVIPFAQSSCRSRRSWLVGETMLRPTRDAASASPGDSWRPGCGPLDSSSIGRAQLLEAGYEESMAHAGRNYGRLWRQATWPLRLQLLIDLILPMACVVLFFLGDTVAGVILVCVICINSAIIWPIIRYRQARRRSGSTGDH
jgi:hypothetical protein